MNLFRLCICFVYAFVGFCWKVQPKKTIVDYMGSLFAGQSQPDIGAAFEFQKWRATACYVGTICKRHVVREHLFICTFTPEHTTQLVHPK